MCLRRHRRRPSVSAYFTLGDDNLYCSVMFVMAIKRLGTNLAPRNVRSHVAQFGRSYIYSFLCVFLLRWKCSTERSFPNSSFFSGLQSFPTTKTVFSKIRSSLHTFQFALSPRPCGPALIRTPEAIPKCGCVCKKAYFRENCVYRKGANSFGDAPLPLALFSRTHVLMWREERD